MATFSAGQSIPAAAGAADGGLKTAAGKKEQRRFAGFAGEPERNYLESEPPVPIRN